MQNLSPSTKAAEIALTEKDPETIHSRVQGGFTLWKPEGEAVNAKEGKQGQDAEKQKG